MKPSSRIRLAAAVALAFAVTGSQAATPTTTPKKSAQIKNIVLVHGYFADGSGWQAVSKILTRDGYTVSVVQEPETSFADDVKATQRIIDMQDGPSILVGHSYGGAVITQAGNDAKVAGLVYLNAFEPEVGESLESLVKQMPGATTAIKPTADGFLYLEPAHFHADFAADVPAREARFMAASQVMPSVQTFTAPITKAAWKTKPSWATVSTADRTVNPALERYMAKRAGSTVVQINSSHVVFLSHPADIARLVERAARDSAK